MGTCRVCLKYKRVRIENLSNFETMPTCWEICACVKFNEIWSNQPVKNIILEICVDFDKRVVKARFYWDVLGEMVFFWRKFLPVCTNEQQFYQPNK